MRARPAPGPDISVALAADNQVTLRRAAAALVHDGLTVTAKVTAPEQLAAECINRQPHVAAVVCDVLGPEATEAVRLLRDRLPRTRLVVVAPSVQGDGIRKAVRAGADGFVFETELELTLAITVRSVWAGQLSLPRDLRHRIEKPALSYREKQVLGMVVMGFTNVEIASKLYLAESTVKSHLSTAFTKLGVRSRNEAAALILDSEAGLGTGILAISGHEGPHAPGNGSKA